MENLTERPTNDTTPLTMDEIAENMRVLQETGKLPSKALRRALRGAAETLGEHPNLFHNMEESILTILRRSHEDADTVEAAIHLLTCIESLKSGDEDAHDVLVRFIDETEGTVQS